MYHLFTFCLCRSCQLCLRQDPDHSGCRKLFKQLKALEKHLSTANGFFENHRWKKAVEELKAIEGLDSHFFENSARVNVMLCKAEVKVHVRFCIILCVPPTLSLSLLLAFVLFF